MTNINPIKFGLTASQFGKKEVNEDLTKTAEKNQTAQLGAKKQLNSNEVLGFLAAQNADMMPAKTTKTVEVSKYVTPEQASRIESFMKGFENDFNELSGAAMAEFPDMTEEAAGSVALAYINSAYAQ